MRALVFFSNPSERIGSEVCERLLADGWDCTLVRSASSARKRSAVAPVSYLPSVLSVQRDIPDFLELCYDVFPQSNGYDAAGVSWLCSLLVVIYSHFPTFGFRYRVSQAREELLQLFDVCRPKLVVMDAIAASFFDSLLTNEKIASACAMTPRIILMDGTVKFRPQFYIDSCRTFSRSFPLKALLTRDMLFLKLYLFIVSLVLRVMLFCLPKKWWESQQRNLWDSRLFYPNVEAYCTTPQFLAPGNDMFSALSRSCSARYIGPLLGSRLSVSTALQSWVETATKPLILVSLRSKIHARITLPTW